MNFIPESKTYSYLSLLFLKIMKIISTKKMMEFSIKLAGWVLYALVFH